MVHDVTTDRFTQDGPYQDVGRKVIQTADARKADRWCISIRAENNKGLSWYSLDMTAARANALMA
jgi:hypothetical protein